MMRKCRLMGWSDSAFSVSAPAHAATSPSPVQSITIFGRIATNPALLLTITDCTRPSCAITSATCVW